MYIVKEEINQQIVDKLKAAYPDAFLGSELVRDMLNIYLKKEVIADVVKSLFDDKNLQFGFLTSLGGMHYPERNSLGVVYHLHSFKLNVRIRLKIETPIEEPTVPTITSIFSAANWLERETYDFFGVIFAGHPNLIRILNEDSMEVFPMRKDIRLQDATREDKNDAMFGR